MRRFLIECTVLALIVVAAILGGAFWLASAT